jgi:signal recognition particle subunit SRP54
MFEALTDRLSGVFDKLTGRGALSEADVDAALREVRVSLLEADVALSVVKDFIAKVKTEAVGESVVKSVQPGQQVVKIVHDALIETLGGDSPAEPLRIDGEPPNVIMLAGLQGSGKTTTTAKIALRLTNTDKRRVLMASLDVRRPAAMEQLATLGKAIGVDVLPIVQGQNPGAITKRALEAAKRGGHDVILLDTAGRTTLDDEMMDEAADIAGLAKPREILLVADSLTGQDAVETARRFHERLPLTGLVLTRADGDGRGGAALSMRAVTGLPIKFLGISENPDGLELFEARRIAGRILGQGDIVGLVEKATAQVNQAEAEKLTKKMAKGRLDFEDLEKQLEQILQIGGLKGIMGMLPGVQKMKGQISDAQLDDAQVRRQIAVIRSMTPAERRKPDLINGSRRKRIARGSGVEVSSVNKLLKMQKQMSDMGKAMGRGKMPFGAMPGMGAPNLEALKKLGGGASAPPKTTLPGLSRPSPSGSQNALPGLPSGEKKS